MSVLPGVSPFPDIDKVNRANNNNIVVNTHSDMLDNLKMWKMPQHLAISTKYNYMKVRPNISLTKYHDSHLNIFYHIKSK